jgi:hypothetical protein
VGGVWRGGGGMAHRPAAPVITSGEGGEGGRGEGEGQVCPCN